MRTVEGLVRQLPFDYSRYTFIDFGSGKGRPMLIASRLGFRRVVGVEYARELHEIALGNIEIFRSRYPDAAPIESVYCDATVYAVPREPCLFFFFSPFRFSVMAKVLGNIKSAVEQPGWPPAAILFVGRNPDSFAQMRALGWTEHPIRLPVDFRRHESRPALLLTHRDEEHLYLESRRTH